MKNLNHVALVRQGPPPWTSEIPDRGDHLWLRKAEDLPAFGEPSTSALQRVRYPDDFAKRYDSGAVYAQPNKVLVSAKRTPNNPWRLKVGLDLRGVIPRETLSLVVPNLNSSVTVAGLVAILSSSVASCWIDTLSPTLSISAEVLKSLPAPDQRSPAWSLLDKAGQTILDGAHSKADALTDALANAEETVRDVYGLSEETREALDRHFAGYVAPEGAIRISGPAFTYEKPQTHGPRRRIGAVLDIRGDKLVLWISGLTPEDGVVTRIPPRFPGWLAFEGATFDCLGDDLSSALFLVQSRDWMSDDELLAHGVAAV